MSAAAKPFITPEEYLRRERLAEFRSEYHNGEILAMAGGLYPHNRVKDNMIKLLGERFKGGPCYTLSSDQKVRISSTNSYVYPDIVVRCEKPRMEDEEADVLLNPKVVIEVLSPSTEHYDRVEKFDMYCSVDSLQEYVLVSQNTPHCRSFVRQADGGWRMTAVTSLTETLAFGTLDVKLPLVEIYEGVDIPKG